MDDARRERLGEAYLRTVEASQAAAWIWLVVGLVLCFFRVLTVEQGVLLWLAGCALTFLVVGLGQIRRRR